MGRFMNEYLKKAVSRRTAFGLLGGASVIAIASPFVFRKGGEIATIVGKIDSARIEALDDEYFLADGWVLSESDLKGFQAPQTGIEANRE